MNNDRQLNYVNNLQNRDQNLYYVDDTDELNNINLKENDKIYAINDNKLFQMEIADQEEELSGSIISFNGRNNTKIKSLVVNIEPVQDLHGYDNPWPAWGGKNKFDAAIAYSEIANGDGTYTATNSGSGMTLTRVSLASYVGQTVTFSLTVTGKTGETNVWYIRGIVNGVGNASSVTNRIMTTDTLPKRIYQTITPETADDRVEISYGSGSGTITFKDIQLEVSSSMTDFAPYSNICPISGWTGANVTRTGANIWDEEWEVGTINVSTGNDQSNSNRIRSKNYIPIKPKTAYEVVMPYAYGVPYQYTFRVVYYDKDKNYLSGTAYFPNEADVFAPPASFTTPPGAYYMRFSPSTNYGNAYHNDIGINYPATDHDYHSGAENTTYPITFPAEAGTVYGGTLDVTNGVLTVDRASDDLGNFTWVASSVSAGTGGAFETAKTITPGKAPSEIGNIMSSKYETLTVGQIYNRKIGIGVTDRGRVKIFDPAIAELTTTEVKAALSGVQFVYELATPFTIDLDPVTVSTISGQTNNVWADAGDVTVKIAEKGITAFELEPHI